jgi:hypothetical protein
VDHVRDLARVEHLERVLDDGHRDPDRVGLLEPVRADQLGPHLTGEEDGRHGVHDGVRDRGHQVRSTGARGRERDADLARRLRVALRRVACALLVTAEDVPDARVVERVVGRQVRATGYAEDRFDALRLQAFHYCVNCAHARLLLVVRLGTTVSPVIHRLGRGPFPVDQRE